MNEKPRVLVTGVGGRSIGHQILHALLLTENGYDITAVDADPFSFGLYQVSKRYLVPPAGDPAYIEAIVALVRSGRIQAVIPGTEAELFVLAEHRERNEAAGCVLLANPLPVVRLCSDKRQLAEWLTANRYGTPRTVTKSDWRRLVADVGFPVVAKPTTNTGGSRNVGLLFNEGEIEQYLDINAGMDVLFQE